VGKALTKLGDRLGTEAADVVGAQTIFNIGGNKYRLIAFVNYRLQIVLVQYVLTTRAASDKEGWKQ